jgi:hypothetical protein
MGEELPLGIRVMFCIPFAILGPLGLVCNLCILIKNLRMGGQSSFCPLITALSGLVVGVLFPVTRPWIFAVMLLDPLVIYLLSLPLRKWRGHPAA